MVSPVFISHSSKDAARVRKLVEALEARGLICWLSERDIQAGDNYGDSIVDAIERAGAMVLVFSTNANNSDEIKKEIALASQRRITVVPVRIEDSQPSKAFRYELATRNWIDLFPLWDEGVSKVAERLAAILDAQIAAPPPTRAPPGRSGGIRLYALLGLALILMAVGAWYATRVAAPPKLAVETPLHEASTSSDAQRPSDAASTPAKSDSKPLPRTTEPPPAPSSALAEQRDNATPAPSGSSDAQTTAQLTAKPDPVSPGVSAATSPSPPPQISPSVRQPQSNVALGAPTLQADDPGGEIFRDCDDCPELVVVPAGKALIGTPLGESGRQTFEAAPHPIEVVKPFALGRYVVTFTEWDACFAEGGCGRRRLGDLDFGRGRRPAIFASWNEAQYFVDWLKRKTGKSYRLPSEAEWEYAARACKDVTCAYSPFWFGPINPELAVYDWRRSYQGSPKADPPLKTSAVDRGRPNAFGLYNMLGNVRQWTQDCWNAAAPSTPSDGSAVLSGDCTERATRGGSWADEPARLRAGARDWQSIDEGSEKIGLRIVRDLFP